MDNREALIEVALDYGEMLMITEHLDGEHLLYVYSLTFMEGIWGMSISSMLIAFMARMGWMGLKT